MADDIIQQLMDLDKDYEDIAEMVLKNKGTVLTKGILGEEDRENISRNLRERLDKKISGRLLAMIDSQEGREEIRGLILEEIQAITQSIPHTVQDTIQEIAEEHHRNITGYGLIQELLDARGLEEFWVLGTDIWYSPVGTEEKYLWEKKYRHVKEVYRLIDRILTPLGKRANEVNTIVDAWLPDRTRVTVNMDPTSIYGPALAFRKHPKIRLSFDDLVVGGTILPKAKELIQRSVEARFNTVVTGGTKSGKTTLLNALTYICPPRLRYIVVEDRHELKLPDGYFATYFITRDAGPDGKGGINYRMLVKNALSISPDAIIMGEARDEAFSDIVDAANTGHELLFSTLHTGDYLGDDGAEGEATMTRILSLLDRAGIPQHSAKMQVSSGIQLDIHIKQFPGKGRRVSRISGFFGMRGDQVQVEDILRYDPVSDKEAVMPAGASLVARLLERRRIEPPVWLREG